MEISNKTRLVKSRSCLWALVLSCLSALCFMSCFLCFDYEFVAKHLLLQPLPLRTLRVVIDVDAHKKQRTNHSEVGAENCNLFEGEWVWDDSYPLYQSASCRFLDQGFRCRENGRPDNFYTKWRWRPRHCDLPR